MLVDEEPLRGEYGQPTPADWSGLDLLSAAVRGTMEPPPISHLTGLRPTAAGTGRTAFTLPVTPWLQNGVGFVDPGILAWLADAPLSTAILCGLEPGRAVLTSELTLTYLQPVNRDTAAIVGRATTLHANRRVGVSTGEITDADGRLLAHGSTRCVVLEVPTAPLGTSPSGPREYPSPDPYLRPVIGDVRPAEVWNERNGLEILRGYLDGEFGPFPLAHLVGGRPIAIDDGRATMRLPTNPWLCGTGPALYGGAIAYLVQSSMEGAILTTLPPATLYATLDLRVHLLRPMFPNTGDLTANAEVEHRGRLVRVATARVLDEAGRTTALARASAMVVPDGIRRMLRGDFAVDAMDAGGRIAAEVLRDSQTPTPGSR